MNPAGPDGPVVTGGPIGPCGAHEALELLEHSVLDQSGPAGRCIAIGHVGPFGMPSPSDCHPAGPAGPYDVGGPVGPDGSMSPSIHKVLKPSEHSVLDHAGPAGRHVVTGPVGQLRTLSPSDCHPAGPAGPYVVGDTSSGTVRAFGSGNGPGQ